MVNETWKRGLFWHDVCGLFCLLLFLPSRYLRYRSKATAGGERCYATPYHAMLCYAMLGVDVTALTDQLTHEEGKKNVFGKWGKKSLEKGKLMTLAMNERKKTPDYQLR